MINSFKSYLLEETKTVYFTFGRMNPPTIGHEKLMNSLATKSGNNPYKIYLSQTQDKNKNPLTYKDKVKFVRKMFPRHARSVVMSPKVKSAMDAASEMYAAGFKKIVMVVGSDRVMEFELLLKKYNGQKAKHGFYDFDSISVISAGERDPDAEGTEGASASKQREYAKKNDFTGFSQGVPKSVSNSDAKSLFNAVRKSMGLKETVDFTNNVKLEKVSETREQYVNGTLFSVGDKVIVKENDSIATVKHLGANYVIIESSTGEQFRKWLDAIEPLEEKKNQPEWGTPDSTATAKKITPGENRKKFKEMYGEQSVQSVDLAKKRIDREKELDAKKHDRMMDRARLRDVQLKNRATQPAKRN